MSCQSMDLVGFCILTLFSWCRESLAFSMCVCVFVCVFVHSSDYVSVDAQHRAHMHLYHILRFCAYTLVRRSPYFSSTWSLSSPIRDSAISGELQTCVVLPHTGPGTRVVCFAVDCKHGVTNFSQVRHIQLMLEWICGGSGSRKGRGSIR